MSSYKTTTLERIELNAPLLKVDKLPLVIDDWTLSFRLGFRGKTFWYLHNNRDDAYRVFKVKKASGGLRTLHNPSPLMRTFSQQLRARILLPLCAQLGPHVSAYQLGKSTADAVKMHVLPCDICAKHDGAHTCETCLEPTGPLTYSIKKQACLACQMPPKHDCPRRGVKIHMDLKDFFGSTKRSWIRKYFHEVVGYNHYVSSLLAQLMTVTLTNPRTRATYQGVPQGSKTSGDICNLIADWRFDKELIRQFPEWKYTRYADDLYFTHPKNLTKQETNAFIRAVEKVVQDSGYRINRKKLHVQRPHAQQRLLGITLNQKLGIPRDQYNRMRCLLHNCVTHGFEAQVGRSKKDNVFHLHNWIKGNLAYYTMVAPARATRLKQVYQHACHLHQPKDPEEGQAS